jgi:DNA-binding LytR/AlgR family response regulator
MNNAVVIFIAEDDWVIAQDLRLSLNQIGYEVGEIADSGEDLLLRIADTQPDLLILDIQLASKLDGIELAHRIRAKYKIPFIFLTSQTDKPTLDRAKVTEPQAFLVKPFNLKEVEAAVEIAIHRFAKNQHADSMSAIESADSATFLVKQHLFIKVKSRLEKVNLTDICWIEAKDIYAVLKTSKGKYVISHSLKDFENQLPADDFMRIHRSFMVSLEKIEAIEDNQVLIGSQYLPIGKTYKDALLKRFTIF